MGFIDITGLFVDDSGKITEYDYCVPVNSIKEVVNDKVLKQTVIRYIVDDSLVQLAVDEDYGTILDKIRATGSTVS